ncbi:hypothetical protein DPMN_044682 [Dreissena polymorpha]|uniref:Uncharacterized protein n=1 Tax=Dreissena polymorpha TaxID=45954 RepID=A0A9D4D4L5_DREPO|nr:hypothetical protein DPMN_044682 [Dreissena polymorpha]
MMLAVKMYYMAGFFVVFPPAFDHFGHMRLVSSRAFASKASGILKCSRIRLLGPEPVLGVYGGDPKNALTMWIEPVTRDSR